MATIEQQIAKKESELARLKDKKKKLANGQKLIIGGMMLSMARDNQQVSQKLLEWINKEVTRQADLDRLEPVVEELKGWAGYEKN